MHVKLDANTESKKDQLLRAAKLSIRGSIRKPYNCIEWASILRLLEKTEKIDGSNLIKHWNTVSAGEHKLQGRKYTCVNALLKLSEDLLQAYLTHVQEMGFDGCAWTEEVLAERKIHVGHRHGSNTTAWSRRTLVTERSEYWMILFCQAMYLDAPRETRRKLSKDTVIDASCTAAFLDSCMDDLRSAGVTEQLHLEAAITPFLNNDVGFLLELNCAMAEKKPTFAVTEISSFKKIIAAATSSTASSLSAAGRPTTDASMLAKKQFELDVETLNVDAEVVCMFAKKLEDQELHLYHTKLQHVEQRESKATKMAESICKSHTQIVFSDKAVDVLQSYELWEKNMMREGLMKDPQQVNCIVVLNWVAMNLYSGGQLAQHSHLSSIFLSQSNRDHLGVVIMPQWTYSSGQLFKQEQQCFQLLSNRGINLDRKFAILQETSDRRDKRPLFLDGRFMVGTQSPNSVWNNSRLRKNQYTKVTQQLKPQDLMMIQNMDEDCVPDATVSVRGARKWVQLGPDTMDELLEACCDGVELSGRLTVIVDFTPGVGDSLLSFWNKYTGNRNLYYFGLATDENHADYLHDLQVSHGDSAQQR